MSASLGSYASASRCSANKTYLQKIRFIDIFDCYSLFTDCRRKRFKSDRTAVVKTNDCLKHSSVVAVKTKFVNFESVKCCPCGFKCDDAV